MELSVCHLKRITDALNRFNHLECFKKVNINLACIAYKSENCLVHTYRLMYAYAQPDGTTLEIRMIGNELCHYTETTDGIMIAQDRSGIWHYAIEQSDGTIAPSNRIAHSIDGCVIL